MEGFKFVHQDRAPDHSSLFGSVVGIFFVDTTFWVVVVARWLRPFLLGMIIKPASYRRRDFNQEEPAMMTEDNKISVGGGPTTRRSSSNSSHDDGLQHHRLSHQRLLRFVLSVWCSFPRRVMRRLNHDDDNDNDDDPPQQQQQQKGPPERRMMSMPWTARLWQGVAAGCVLVNVVAMVVEMSAVSILAGLVALTIAPVVFLRQPKLQQHNRDGTYACVAMIRAGLLAVRADMLHLPCARRWSPAIDHSLILPFLPLLLALTDDWPRLFILMLMDGKTALRQVQNELRRQVERLHQENDQLSLQVRTLDGQVDRFVPNNTS
jgi:hypothetical protein